HDRDTMFVGVNSVLDPTYRGRVLVTTDGGAHWDVLPGRDAQINHLSLHPDGEVLAVADGADPFLGGPPETVRLTNDRGATWVELPGSWKAVNDLHWIGDDLYVASGADGLLRVPDAVGVAAGEVEAERQLVFRPGLLGWANRIAGDEQTLLVDAALVP